MVNNLQTLKSLLAIMKSCAPKCLGKITAFSIFTMRANFVHSPGILHAKFQWSMPYTPIQPHSGEPSDTAHLFQA